MDRERYLEIVQSIARIMEAKKTMNREWGILASLFREDERPRWIEVLGSLVYADSPPRNSGNGRAWEIVWDGALIE